MTKVGLISDTHFGARNDQKIFLELFGRYIKEIFVPRLCEEGITTLFHLGDIVDKRKSINFLSLQYLVEDFLKPAKESGIDVHLVVGNHDTFYRNRNDLNASIAFREYLASVYDEPSKVEIYGRDVFLIPWVNESNHEQFRRLLEEECSSDTVILGHLEIAGFRYNKRSMACEGMNPLNFGHVAKVLSGHFHTPSRKGNIEYIGSPFQITWADEGEARGGYIFDLQSLELEMIENPFEMFKKVDMDYIRTNGKPDIPFVEVIVDDASAIDDSIRDVIDSNTKITLLEVEDDEPEGIVDADAFSVIETAIEDRQVRNILKKAFERASHD